MRLLDAGCGVGQLSVEAARRGAEVLGVDISPNLLEVARDRMPEDARARVTFVAGDMLDEDHGRFDYVVAMDSLIHYRTTDIADALARLSTRTSRAVDLHGRAVDARARDHARRRQGVSPLRPLARHHSGARRETRRRAGGAQRLAP